MKVHSSDNSSGSSYSLEITKRHNESERVLASVKCYWSGEFPIWMPAVTYKWSFLVSLKMFPNIKLYKREMRTVCVLVKSCRSTFTTMCVQMCVCVWRMPLCVCACTLVCSYGWCALAGQEWIGVLWNQRFNKKLLTMFHFLEGAV